jgi:subtilase family serine protease
MATCKKPLSPILGIFTGGISNINYKKRKAAYEKCIADQEAGEEAKVQAEQQQRQQQEQVSSSNKKKIIIFSVIALLVIITIIAIIIYKRKANV